MVKVFHIQKGDLCRITEDFNKQYVKTMFPICAHGELVGKHPDYGDLLIAVSDPKFRGSKHIYVETYNQIKMTFFTFNISVLEKV